MMLQTMHAVAVPIASQESVMASRPLIENLKRVPSVRSAQPLVGTFFASLLPYAKIRYEETTMKCSVIFRVLAILLLLACNSAAYSMEKIGWDQLVPQVDQSKNPFETLPKAMIHDFSVLWSIYKRMVAGNSSEGQDRLANKSIAALEAAGVDVRSTINDMVEYTRLVKENGRVLVEELNGKSVAIKGYLLPTEFSGDRIVEFLLVPSDGACVHTPVPPLNQLVYVKLPRGIDNRSGWWAYQHRGKQTHHVLLRWSICGRSRLQHARQPGRAQRRLIQRCTDMPSTSDWR
jgi:hypothetical protein